MNRAAAAGFTTVLLLPKALAGSFLREQIEDLLQEPGVIALEPGRLPYGSLGRLPWPLASLLASIGSRQAKVPSDARVFVIFHPWQFPYARALLNRHPGSELWFSRWDRYEAAYSDRYYAKSRLRARIVRMQQRARDAAALVFAASTRLAALEEEEVGRRAELVPLSADSFPALDSRDLLFAASLGHLGKRTDWALLRALAERLPELVILLIGRFSDEENAGSPDYAACRERPNIVWLGYRDDEAAARLIACVDVAIVPYSVEPYNDAALPHRILKCARLGRRSICPDLAGASTWEPAVVRARNLEEWVAALRAHAGARASPDEELRAWALAQTARRYNEPLRERLQLLRTGGE